MIVSIEFIMAIAWDCFSGVFETKEARFNTLLGVPLPGGHRDGGEH